MKIRRPAKGDETVALTMTAESRRYLARLRSYEPQLVLGFLITLLIALQLWFIWERRRLYPLFIDESGFLATAMQDRRALFEGGLRALFTEFRSQPLYAPLLPLATVPLALLTAAPVTSAFATVVGFYVLLIIATYWIARRFLSPWWAVLCALVVAISPEAIGHSRSYTFGVPAAALFTAAVLCFLRSEALDRVWWALAGAVLLAMAALTRTMMLGFVPAPFLAVGIQAAARGLTRRRVAAFTGAIGVAMILSLTWYSRTLPLVYDYLVRRKFRPPEAPRAPFFLDALGLLASVQIPLALAMLAMTFAAIWFRRRSVRSVVSTRRAGWRERLSGEPAFLWIVVLWGALVLAATDEALAQWLPVLGLVLVLLVRSLTAVPKVGRQALAALTIVAALLTVAVTSSFFPGLGRARGVSYGRVLVPLIDGRTLLQAHLDTVGLPSGPAGRLPQRFREWPVFTAELTKWLRTYAERKHESPVVYFAAWDPILNVNEIWLRDRLAGRSPTMSAGTLTGSIEGRQIDIEESEIPYNFLILMDPPPKAPEVVSAGSLRRLEGQARAHGFKQLRSARLPDGRDCAVFWRSLSAQEDR